MSTPTTLEAVQAQRQTNRDRKRVERAEATRVREALTMAPNPSGYITPRPPVHYRARKAWLADRHHDYAQRRISIIELDQCRKTADSLANQDKAASMVRQSRAAMKSADAQDKLAALVAGMRDGGVAAALLLSLRGNGDATRYAPIMPRPGALPGAGVDVEAGQ